MSPLIQQLRNLEVGERFFIELGTEDSADKMMRSIQARRCMDTVLKTRRFSTKRFVAVHPDSLETIRLLVISRVDDPL